MADYGSVPDITFGICPICGGSAGDDADAEGADASARDTDGNGTELILFRGEYICPVCKEDILAEEESLKAADARAEEEQFRSQAGFTKTIE